MPELRKEMKEYIDEADENLLNILKKIVESYRDKNIVAYTTAGEPLNREEYSKKLKEAENAIKKGEYISQEDLEKESENWWKN